MTSSLKELITQAQAGNLSLTATPDAFVSLEKVLIDRIDRIVTIQLDIRAVAEQEVWGLGEASAVLTSAQTLVRRFREKADAGPNNAVAALQSHRDAADDLLVLIRTIRQRYEETDAAFAAKFKELATAQGLDTGGNR